MLLKKAQSLFTLNKAALRLSSQSFKFSSSPVATDEAEKVPDRQDDFFTQIPARNQNDKIVKVDELEKTGIENANAEEFDYEGRLADRVTEDDYEMENLMTYDQKFADKVRVFCLGGAGGNGCVSYQRENYGFKLPDGGSGGKGGDVYFRSTYRLANLYELRRAHFKGNNGKAGKSDKANGTDGRDIHYSVPIGTEVFEIKRNRQSKEAAKAFGAGRDEIKIKVSDLDHEGQSVRMARGGNFGIGNFKDKQLKILEKGQEGEKKEYELRLKVIADIGFIGYPNAGKSTLLSALTRAFPKIAHYPFTTLRPYIGQVKFVDDTKLIFADLPGIIEGAHMNRGLGHEFLQHAERTKVLLYVIDGTVTDDDRTPLKDFNVLQEELRLYKNGILLKKPQVLAVNKSDRAYTNFNKRYQTMQKSSNIPIVPISAKEGTNLEVLLETLKDLVEQEIKKAEQEEDLY